jgi:hypothetical protein
MEGRKVRMSDLPNYHEEMYKYHRGKTISTTLHTDSINLLHISVLSEPYLNYC